MSECGDQSSPHEVIHLVKHGGLAVCRMPMGDGGPRITRVALLRGEAELPGGKPARPRQEACLTGLVARIIHRPTRERRRPWKARWLRPSCTCPHRGREIG